MVRVHIAWLYTDIQKLCSLLLKSSPGEFEGELLFPLCLQILPDCLGRVQPAKSRFVYAVRVDLLGEDDQGGLSGLADLGEKFS